MLFAFVVLVILALIFLGMDIGWSIGIGCLSFLTASHLIEGMRPVPFVLLPQQMTVGLDSYTLLAIPLFIMAGLLMSAAGVAKRLIRFASALVGHIHGGLANVAVTANFALSGMSGSAIADASATGIALIPEMKRKNYPGDFAAAVIAASSTIAPIIPPSILFVLIGAIMNLSVGRLFLAGIVPGVLMFTSMFALTYWVARRRKFPREVRASAKERRAALLDAVLPLLAPFIVLRAMMMGLATPTEAAAILVFYIMFLGLVVYRVLTFAKIFECAARAAIMTSAIMIMVATSAMFTWLAVQQKLGQTLAEGMLSLTGNVYVLLLLFNVLLLILGMFVDALPVMLVLAPIVFPLMASLGVDPIHLGVVMVVNLTMGLLTPPVGLCLSVVAMISGSDVVRVFREVAPYFAVLVAVLLLITYVPALTLAIPDYFMGR